MNTPSHSQETNTPGFCQVDELLARQLRIPIEEKSRVRTKHVHHQSQKYNWSAEQVGTLLGSFYWGYCLSMLPGAIIAQKYGSYRVILLSCYVNAILTFFFPYLVNYGGYPMAVIIRVILGVASGLGVFPFLVNSDKNEFNCLHRTPEVIFGF